MLPSPVFNVTVMERRSSKLMLGWIPGHDGFSPLTKCHIRVSSTSTQTALLFNALRSILTCYMCHLRWKKWVGGKGRWRPPDSSMSQCHRSSVKSLGCRQWRGTTWAFPAVMKWAPLLSPCGSRATLQREVCVCASGTMEQFRGWMLLMVGDNQQQIWGTITADE